jgi:2-phosphoglycerate kinase
VSALRRDALRVPVSLLVVTGPPGVGKSTIAALVADRLPRSVLVEGDAFFAFLRQGAIEPWRPESHAQNEIVTAAAALATGRFARDYATVYDGVMGPWFVDTFLAASGLDGLDYMVLLPDVEVCVERVMTRENHVFRNEAAARKMHHEFARFEIDPRHLLANHSTAEAAADEILDRWERGDLRIEAQ